MIKILLLWSVYIAILYVVYKIWLSKLSFFTLNRFFILSGIVVGFLAVLPTSKSYVTTTFPDIAYIEIPLDIAADTTQEQSFNPLLAIYISGFILSFLLLVFKLIKLSRVLRFKSANTPSFSFFSFIHINQEQENKEIVMEHENIHVQKLHSLDIFLLECLKVILWFNPFVYLIEKELKLLHELEVDATLFQKYGKIYAELLVASALHTDIHTLTNTFGIKNLTKNRIVMMTKNNSTKAHLLRYVVAVPAMVLAFLLINPTIAMSQQDTVVEDVTQLTKMHEFEGGQLALMEYLQSSIVYPLSAKQDGVEGRVFISFVVDKSGAIRDVKSMKSVHPDLEAEAIRVITEMPNWEPAEIDGEKVSAIMYLPIVFALKKEDKK
jgi:TonB family protein